MPPVARRAKQANRINRIFGRIFAIIGITVFALSVLVIGAVTLLFHGPSATARDLLTATLTQSDTWAFVPRLFLSSSLVQEILENNTIIPLESFTDSTVSFTEHSKDIPLDTIELLNVQGSLYTGTLLIVHDPSRLLMVIAPDFTSNNDCTIQTVAKTENPVAAIGGNTVSETSLVILNHSVITNSVDGRSSVVAITDDNHLLVGAATIHDLLNSSVRDAVSAGPALIVDGQTADISGNGSGLSKYTVIGQRADGALLLLVLDRATLRDCAELMLQQNAINAAVLNNFCSAMAYNGDFIQSDVHTVFQTAFVIR